MFSKYTFVSGTIVFIITIVVYTLTLAPTVFFIDSGELAAVASTLGIAHPTGYPLFTLIGHIFSLLPFSDSQIYKLNFMSTFFCILAAVIFFYFICSLLKESNKEKSNISIYSALAGCGALILAFSKTFWSQANSVEVYPLHVLFLCLNIFIFLTAVTKRDNPVRLFCLFAFTLGLSFTNHLTTILLAPACLTLFFVTFGFQKQTYRLLGFMAIFFILGFSLYLYLPVRSASEPALIWGYPHTFERFYWHITGKQFSVWIFSAKGSIPVFLFLLVTVISLSFTGLKKMVKNEMYHIGVFAIQAVLTFIFLSGASDIVTKQFSYFRNSLWLEFGSGIVLLALPGLLRLIKFDIRIYYFTLLTFFGCIFYSVNYDINDISSYFLLAYISIAIWIIFGIYFIYEKITAIKDKTVQNVVFGLVLLITIIIPLKDNYKENDESKNYCIQELTFNIFENAEPNSIIFSSQWDFWVSSSWYFHFVKKIRQDLVVIDKELLRRSWYFKFIENNYPEIYNHSKNEIERFLVELNKFEHDLPYDQKTIMKTYSDLMTSFVANNPGRRFYSTWEIEQTVKNEPYADNYLRVPDGLLIRLVKPDENQTNIIKDYKIHDFKFTPTNKSGYYHETTMLNYALMLTNSASYLASNGRIDDAKKYLEIALFAKPGYQPAIDLKRKFGL